MRPVPPYLVRRMDFESGCRHVPEISVDSFREGKEPKAEWKLDRPGLS